MQQESVVRARNLPPDQARRDGRFHPRGSRLGVDEFCGNALAAGADAGAAHRRTRRWSCVWLGGRCIADWGAGARIGREPERMCSMVFLMPSTCRLIIGSR